MNESRSWLVSDLWQDLKIILEFWNKPLDARSVLWAVSACDGFLLLVSFRTRKRLRHYGIPFVNRFMRGLETALFAIELSSEAELGHGVYFMHTVGTIVGGDAKIGARCILLGNNTIGQSERPGYPTIGAGTIIGTGTRVLGRIEIGEGCALGANAVVLQDVPAGKIALGIPARIAGDNPRAKPLIRDE